MVAVANGSSADAKAAVTLVAGDEASGLARMVGLYLEQVLADSPAKQTDAAALRGHLALRATEGDVAVTIVFGDEGVLVEEGLVEPDATISAGIETLMNVLAGRANPGYEMLRRTLTVRPSLRHPLFGYRAYNLMRLPEAHLWSGLPRPPTRLLVGAAMVFALLLVLHARHHTGGDDDA